MEPQAGRKLHSRWIWMGIHVLCRNPWGSRVCRRADAPQSQHLSIDVHSHQRATIFLLIYDHAYLASASWSRPGQPEPSLGILHTGTKKEHQSLGLKDLKCKAQELSASHVFHHTEEGSLQRKNHGNTQRQKKNLNSLQTPLAEAPGLSWSIVLDPFH